MTGCQLELGEGQEDLAQLVEALKAQLAKVTAERDEARNLAKVYSELCREQRLEMEEKNSAG